MFEIVCWTLDKAELIQFVYGDIAVVVLVIFPVMQLGSSR